MKGLSTIAVLLGALSVTQAANTPNIEQRLSSILTKNELHSKKAALLNQLQLVDEKIHAMNMADDTTTASNTTAADSTTADDSTTKADNTTAADSTTTADNTTSTDNSTKSADTTTSTDSTTKADDTTTTDSSTKAADTTTTTSDSGATIWIVVGVLAAVGAGVGIYFWKCKKNDESAEGGDRDDKYAKFLDNELNNWRVICDKSQVVWS